MNYAADEGESFGTALAFLGFLPFFLLLVVWLVCGAVASASGPQRYSGRLFVLTLFFLAHSASRRR
jgi:hypothetical protein